MHNAFTRIKDVGFAITQADWWVLLFVMSSWRNKVVVVEQQHNSMDHNSKTKPHWTTIVSRGPGLSFNRKRQLHDDELKTPRATTRSRDKDQSLYRLEDVIGHRRTIPNFVRFNADSWIGTKCQSTKTKA